MESQRDGGGDVEFMILMSGMMMMMMVGIGFAGGSAWLCLRRRRGRLLFTTLLFVGFSRCVAGSRRCHFEIECEFCDLFLTLIANRICCLDSVWDLGEFSVSHLDGRVGLSVVGYISSQLSILLLRSIAARVFGILQKSKSFISQDSNATGYL